MSAFLAIRKSASVELLADAAAFNGDGSVASIASKIVVHPDFVCAIAGRGPVILGAYPYSPGLAVVDAAAVLQVRTFDEMVMHFHAISVLVERACRAHFGDRHYDLLIAGWSETREAPEAYSFTTFAWPDGPEPGRLHPGEEFYVGGTFPAWEKIEAQGFSNPATGDEFDIMRDGLAFMEAMRRERSPIHFGDESAPPAFIIGGFVERATVTRTGVRREIIRRWPDEIGKPINPDAAPAVLAA